MVLSPAIDGGYTLIGLSQVHDRLFEDIPWSTEAVHRLTEERAAEIGLKVCNVAPWYDVDDAASLASAGPRIGRRSPIIRLAGTPVGPGARNEGVSRRRFCQKRSIGVRQAT